MDHFGQLTMKQTIAKWNVCAEFEKSLSKIATITARLLDKII